MDLVTTTQRVPAGGETLTASGFATFPGGKGANQAVACARAASYRHRQGAGDCDDSPDPDARPDNYDNEDGKHEDNTHVHSAGATIKVSMTGAVGQDAYGDLLLSTLTRDGINCDTVSRLKDCTTGVAVIIVEEKSGENRILITPGANGRMHKGAIDLSSHSLSSPKPDLIVMQLEIPSETVFSVIAQAKAQHIDVLLNPAPAVQLPDEALDGLAHLVLNETEAAILCGLDVPDSTLGLDSFLDSAFSILMAKGVQTVVITLGGNGVAFCMISPEQGKSQWRRLRARRVDKVVDTTAAGDTFVGYYAVGLAKEKLTQNGSGKIPPSTSLEGVVEFANRAAALTVTRHGAMSSIPYGNEVA